ncbi:hypothetical protein GCM10010411_72480 [Actinomadura fulvescens]|uniref:Molecular chaperone DnaK n=1 Tax=Actinomadura fulvescens TaxID=46160 RepID=A0ABN3QGI2_9ACTN
MAVQRLREAAEMAKIDLSSARSTTIHLPYITAEARGPLDLTAELTREEFEHLSRETLGRCDGPIRQVLEDSGIAAADIDLAVLVGGATRMPAIDGLVHQFIKGQHVYRGLIPDGVVKGATLQSAILQGERKDTLLLDVTPLSLGIETKGGIFTKIIERNTTLPTKRSETFNAQEGQRFQLIRISQGEREVAAYNRLLGVFRLELHPEAAETPQIEVTFDIDANAVVHVSAKELETGRESDLTIGAAPTEQPEYSNSQLPLVPPVPPPSEAPTSDIPVT